jgi:hypothetical protein
LWAKLREKVAGLWRRAPLLVLLGGWFLIGLVGGLLSVPVKMIWPNSWFVETSDFAFQAWGMGFLALIVFGFWARVRRQ